MGLVLLLTTATLLSVVAWGQVRTVDHELTSLVAFVSEGAEHELQRGNFRLKVLTHEDIQEDSLHLVADHTFMRWYRPEGRLVWETGLGVGIPKTIPPLGFITVQGREERFRQLTFQVPEGTLQIGFSLKEADQLWQEVLIGFLVVIPLLEGVIGLAAWFLAGRAMVPIQASYQKLEQFTADAAHELRTPVATLLATAQSALDQDATLAHRKFQTIVHTAQRMAQLTEDLLWLARNEEQASMQSHCVLNGILADLHEELAAQALAKDLTFTCTVPHQPMVILGCEAQLYRLFTNLLTNAFKYTPVGGQVEMILTDLGHVHIQDTGVGIPAKHLPKLFERFYRVDSARQVGGFGLGLAIVAQVVTNHHGRIEVLSTPGQGTTFMVFLPLATTQGLEKNTNLTKLLPDV